MSSDARRRISITSISSQLQPRSRPASPSLSVASSTNSGSPSRKRLTSFRNTLRRVSSVGGSSSRGSGRNVVHPLPNEKPVAILRVRILGCKNLTAADWNGKSDPYVSVTFARQKFKTPVISRNLNPIYQPKDATFDFPIYSSVVEKIGANIEVIVWDKDVVGKDYLGEVSIPYNDWAAHSGRGPTSISYLDKGNSTFWMDLVSTKEKKTASGSVHMKIGLAQPADNPRPLDFPHVYTDLQRHVAAAGLNPLTASPVSTAGISSHAPHQDGYFTSGLSSTLSSPSTSIRSYSYSLSPQTQGYGTYDSEQNTIPFNVGKADMDDERETEEQALRDRGSPVPENLALPPPPPLTMPTFSIVWKGTRVEYSFSKGKEILGIVMLDIHNAEDLPKSNSAQRGGWDMDPYLMINYGSKTFRTRVVRHSLSPTWDEKILFHVLRADADTVDPTSPHPQNTTVHFKLLDWDKNTTDDIVGDTEFDFAELIAAAPLPDETTGLYPEESVESRNSMKDVRLPLIIAKDVGLETRHAPYLNIRARYEPHAVFRQRFWRTQLVQFDVDKSGTFSRSEIIALLADLGLALDKAVLADFFTRFGKDMEKDDLEFEEALMCLEEELGLRPSVKPERLSRAPTGVSGKAEGETASVPTSAPTMESERVPSPDVQPSAAKEELQAVGLEPAFEEAPRPAPKPSPSGYMSDESEGEVENAIPDTIIEDQEEPAEHPAPAAGTPELVEPDGFPWSKPSAEEPASQEDPWFTSPTEGEALTPASEVPLPASPSLSAERPGSPYAPGTPLRGSSASLPAPPSPSIVVTDDEKSEPIFPPQHRSPASTHGRSSTSLTNLRTQLTSIFAEHPESKVDPTTNAPTLPVGAITAVLGRFSARYDVQLLNPGEEEQLNAFTARFTDMTITPDSLMELIAKMTGAQQGAAVEEKETQPQPQPEVQVETEAENEKAGGEDEKDRLGVPGAREGGLLYLGSESVSSSNVSVYHSEALEHEGHETGGSEESLPTHPDFALDTPLEGAHDPLLDPAGAFSPPESTDAGTEVPMDISELDGLYAHADEEEEDVEVPHIQPTPAEHMHIPLDIEERISELNTTNADLQRQLKEVEERTHRTIAEQEAQLEEGQIRIEELRAEVLASRREAKEMKGKERNYVQQVTSVGGWRLPLYLFVLSLILLLLFPF
ncbi:hypothetical protein BOTBODRAFT_157427 [Botryobasidium botryosum FD-172 SS1]|uniref:C2 domain-containing protein n=1 Tax=Botryobasidium botryosum (strain FD-172 SS1) TaxID=930990 RepID=A0A067MN40_BOTB1|nr:hypothetical protein BOTBODRAFT_157427 [Botryobasidium botryosum FD-172 SS1]